jgi:hypothetical protein
MKAGKCRDSFLGVFGPLSMLFLLAFWAAGLVLGFALLHFAAEHEGARRGESFVRELYMSGETFFTLGLGDVTPHTHAAKLITVTEAGMGFGFLALVIGYLPVLYGAFSKREVTISLLDARAGSPPSAVELLHRYGGPDQDEELASLLAAYETWTAELMESHLSYPVLCYYRSQHDNQSWIAALTTILDACALLRASRDANPRRRTTLQARLTFAIARHAAVDLAQVLRTAPRPPAADRLSAEVADRLHASLAARGAGPEALKAAAERLREYRKLYEPYVNALSAHLMMELPRFDASSRAVENWRTSAWEKIAAEPGVTTEHPAVDEEHA